MSEKYDSNDGLFESMVANTLNTSPNQYHINCKNIEKQLRKHNVKVRFVSRHHLFNDYLYLIRLENHGSNDEIREALHIPDEWVQIYSTQSDKWEWAVDENKLNEKYCDDKGILQFDLLNELEYSKFDEIEVRADADIAVEIETEKCMQRVFDLIDEEIRFVKTCESMFKTNSDYYKGAYDMLKFLKKELSE